MNKNVLTLHLAACALLCIPTHARAMDTKKELMIFYAKHLSAEIPVGFALLALNTLFHELGHATSSYAFTGTMPHIYIGSSSNSTALIETPCVTVNGFSPIDGRTSYPSTQDSIVNWKKIIRTAAGPLTGVLFSLGLSYLAAALYKNPTFLFTLLLRSLYAFNVAQFIPSNHNGKSDGYHLAEQLGISNTVLQPLQTYGEIPLNIVTVLAFLIGPMIEKAKALVSMEYMKVD